MSDDKQLNDQVMSDDSVTDQDDIDVNIDDVDVDDTDNSQNDEPEYAVDKEVEESNKIASTLLSLQNLIERNANELDVKKQQLKQLREQLKNVFDNDTELANVSEQATKITQQLKERKQSIDNQPEVRQLKLKMVDLKDEVKEIEETLNLSCINLFQMTGSNSFDTSDGDQREFELKARVKSKKHSE